MAEPGRASVLYVTYDGLLEPLGASQVLPYVWGLVRRGVSMEILSFEKPADLEDGGDTGRLQALKRQLGERGVSWSALRYHKRPSLPATAWDVLAGRRSVAGWAAARRRAGLGGIVHARGYLPGLMGLAGQGGAVKLLFDMRGFWVDERIEGGYWAPGSLPVRLGRRVERRLLRDADHLVVLTHRGVARLPDLADGAPSAPATVVPTCVDLDRFRIPHDRAAARDALGLDRGPVLIHVGTLTGWYDGRATMAVARAFLARTGGSFVVLTRDVTAAEAMVREAGVEARVASAAPEEVPLWLQASDAGLALVRPSPSKDASFPTKVGEYLASGLAVLATPVGDLERMADGTVLGLLRPEGGVEAAVTWLERAAAAPDRMERARTLAEAKVSIRAGVEALAGVYAQLGIAPEPVS